MHGEPGHGPVHLCIDDLEFRDLLSDRYPHPLQSVVLPIMTLREGLIQLRGTAFSIGGQLALTAHHVLTQEDRDIDEVALLHVVEGPGPYQVHATLLEVEDVTAHPGGTDVSVLRLKSPPAGHHNPLPLRPMRLGMAPPDVGHPVAILGYTHDREMSTVEEALQLRPHLHVSEGKVIQHSLTGHGWCKGPCYQVEAKTLNQMSGGPVLAPAGDGTDRVVVRGVVSTGINVAEDDAPLTTAAMTFTSMALAPVVNRGTSEEPTLLYDLARDGRIPVVDLDLVDLDASDLAHPRIGLHRPAGPRAKA